jgi:hypothetical protein
MKMTTFTPLRTLVVGSRPLRFKKGWHVKTTLRDVFHVTFSGLLLIVLTACGGGGGGGVSVFNAMPSSPPPQILQSAPAPQEPFDITSTTLGASSGGKSYTAIYSETPNQGTTMFDGQEANSSTISLTITENGAPIATEIDTTYDLESPYQQHRSASIYAERR